MLDFIKLRNSMHKNFEEIFRTKRILLETETNGYELAELYVSKLPQNIFRQRSYHNCNYCKNFIRKVGTMVYYDEQNKIRSIWDFKSEEPGYQVTLDAMRDLVLSKKVLGIKFIEEKTVGVESNFDALEAGLKFDHLYQVFPEEYVGINTAEFREKKQLLERAIAELKDDVFDLTLTLIDDGLERGLEYRSTVENFGAGLKEARLINKRNEFLTLVKNTKRGTLGFRNSVIGTLVTDLSEGMDISAAVFRFENKMDPTKFKRPREVFTEGQKKQAIEKIKEAGLENSLNRRVATLDDLNVNHCLFLNRDAKVKKEEGLDALVEKALSVSKPKVAKTITNWEELTELVQNSKKIDLFLEQKLEQNLMTLITAKDQETKSLFGWQNNFSWAYKGNVTSSFKNEVKEAGGNVEGEIRCSLKWNDGTKFDGNDLDLHCVEPGGREINYSAGYRKDRGNSFSPTGGQLDLDVVSPRDGVPAIENIYWSKMPKNGDYLFYVKRFSGTGNNQYGFKAEIEVQGEIYSFEVSRTLKHKEDVKVATVKIENGQATVINHLETSKTLAPAKDIWGLTTNKFYNLVAVTKSPNYWEETGTQRGNEHLFFFLPECKATEELNGFYNEFLSSDLVTYKNFFAALGAVMKVTPENGLAGVGFSRTNKINFLLRINDKQIVEVKIN